MACPSLAVFVYDWPHRKSVEVLLRLWLEQLPVGLVLGAPPVAIAQVRSIRLAVRSPCSVHPLKVAARMGVTYVSAPHTVEHIAEHVQHRHVTRAVIGGARILPKDVIALFPDGVLNLHPAPLPAVRGQRSLAKTIARQQHPAVSAHWIDERQDAGELIGVCPIDWRDDDTAFDVSEKLYQLQLNMMADVLK